MWPSKDAATELGHSEFGAFNLHFCQRPSEGNSCGCKWSTVVLQLSYSCTCLKYLAYSCACYFLWKWGKNDKSLLPLQQIEDVAFLATCFPLNIFPTGGKNVGYYSRPSETKNSCVNSRFSQTRIIVIDMHSFYMFSYGKCPYIDGAKHKYCSDNSAVKHICNQWFFFIEHVALFPPDLTSFFFCVIHFSFHSNFSQSQHA